MDLIFFLQTNIVTSFTYLSTTACRLGGNTSFAAGRGERPGGAGATAAGWRDTAPGASMQPALDTPKPRSSVRHTKVLVNPSFITPQNLHSLLSYHCLRSITITDLLFGSYLSLLMSFWGFKVCDFKYKYV